MFPVEERLSQHFDLNTNKLPHHLYFFSPSFLHSNILGYMILSSVLIHYMFHCLFKASIRSFLVNLILLASVTIPEAKSFKAPFCSLCLFLRVAWPPFALLKYVLCIHITTFKYYFTKLTFSLAC